MPAPTSEVTLYCARCGRVAARFRLLAPGESGRDARKPEPFRGEDRLVREGFLGTVTFARARVDLEALLGLIRAGDYSRASDLEPESARFFCFDCERVYCDRCWQVEPPAFDDGFYDYTEATCPQGHRHIVDD